MKLLAFISLFFSKWRLCGGVVEPECDSVASYPPEQPTSARPSSSQDVTALPAPLSTCLEILRVLSERVAYGNVANWAS